jgi:glycosyltransferase involved in cell wall biosynthesis
MRQSPRCALVLPSFAGGGAERVMLQMAARLPGHGIDIELVVLDGRGPLAALVPPGTATTVLGTPRMREAVVALRRHLRRSRPAWAVSSFGHVTAPLAALVATLRPRPLLVAREPNMPSLSMAGGGINRWLRLACRLAYPRCDLVVASSERMAAELRRDYGVRSGRLSIVHNPIDETMIRARAGAAVSTPPCRRLFVASGRMVEQKGFDRLIAIWTRTRPDDMLVLLGDGPDRLQLEHQAAHAGLGQRVLFRGWEDNPWAWYARADAMLVPSRFEGMPNAALEALACGTPVIATPEAGGLVELTRDVPAHGLGLTASDRFAEAIAQLPRRDTTVLAPSLLPPRFRAETVARELAKHLASMLT